MGIKWAHKTAFYVALVAMLFRAFLPDGWMPSPSTRTADAGWFPLVICTSHGLVHLNGSGKASHGGDGQQHHAPCPYAAAAHLAQGGMGASAALYDVAFVFAPLFVRQDGPAERSPLDLQRSRAPPLLSI